MFKETPANKYGIIFNFKNEKKEIDFIKIEKTNTIQTDFLLFSAEEKKIFI